ncbi:MAG: orotidine-5'-phosphate decarboxylase [Chlamydiales bacterium]
MKSFSERASYTLNPTAQKLFKLMDLKQTNLALAADVTSSDELVKLADSLGPQICLLKTHIDILADFSPQLPHRLQELAEKHHFLLFEDRKFADIGHTVKEQYLGGMYRISDWADLITAHTISGPNIIEGLKQVGLPKGKGVLLLAEMSSKETLAKGAYTRKTVVWGQEHAEFVAGFICTHKLTDDPAFLHMTPGVHLEKGSDGLGQRYLSVKEAIEKRGSDVVIVGRGIYQASDPIKMAESYRQEAWHRYRHRLIMI